VGLDAAVVLILAAASFRLLVRPGGGPSPGRSLLGFAGAWFFVILAPSSSVVPVATEIIAEHRMYLPLAAVIAVAVCGGYALVERALARARADGRAARPYLMICVGAAVALGCMTVRRNLDYRDNQTLWSDIVAKAPENPGAHNNLGNILFEQGRLMAAIDQYRQALQLVPDYADAHFNLGNALVRLGRLPDAIENYRAALRYRPEDPAIHAALGTACYRLGNAAAEGNRPEEAAAAYAEAVGEQPNFADAHVNYGNILAELGRVAEAVAEYEQVLRLEPSSADAHNNLGSLLAGQGRRPEARAQFEEALRLKPDYRAARDNLRRLETIAPAPRAP
jgi:tetratricopeptide (TPR) repeat protein